MSVRGQGPILGHTGLPREASIGCALTGVNFEQPPSTDSLDSTGGRPYPVGTYHRDRRAHTLRMSPSRSASDQEGTMVWTALSRRDRRGAPSARLTRRQLLRGATGLALG